MPSICSIALLGMALLGLARAVPVNAADPAATRLTAFDLIDHRGRRWTLADFQNQPVLVVAFLGTECPLAKHYSIRLQALADQFADAGVAMIAVMSNRQDSLAEIGAFVERQQLRLPVLKDTGNRVADQVGAERTPEIFVFDSERQLQYRGRVDDQYGIGYVREDARRHDLVVAIEEILAGKPVSVPRTDAIGCIIGRQKQTEHEIEVTYGGQIAEILNRHCVECHREGEIAPFALTEYDEVAGWADMIAEVVADGRMPPWHASGEHAKFRNDRSLSADERQALYDWAAAGAPAGDLTRLPEPPEQLSGWQLPQEPDRVIPIQQQPFTVPATGVVPYQYFYFDPDFREDVWVKAFEIKPGNRAVVHHILGFAVDKGTRRVMLQAAQGFKFNYVPGVRSEPLPAGHAIRIPAGKALLFQVHYTTVGTPQQDQSELGLVLADPDEVTHEVIVASAMRLDLRIPPHAPHHVERAAGPEFPPDAELLAINAHMHVRGKSFRYDLEVPGEPLRTIADIPHYDFNWQTTYVYQDPIPVPPGSRILCEAVYDNSEQNLNNPNPDDFVTFGDQTWDEMLIGYYLFAVPRGRSESGLTYAQLHEKSVLKANLLQLFELIDSDGDGKVTKAQLPGPAKLLFDQYNRDRDDYVTTTEIRGEMPPLVELLLATIFKVIR